MNIFNIRHSYTGIAKCLLIYGFLLLFFLSVSACSKPYIKSEKDFVDADNENISYLLRSIEKVNINSPRSFYTNFNVEGQSGKQTFKAIGNAQYNNDPRKMRVVFHDAVFKSPISEIIQEGDIIKFYFPFDKRLYIDNVKTIKLKFYSNFDLDSSLVFDLSAGRIPLIRNFSIIKGLEGKSSPEAASNKLIILENDDYYETISFLRDIPDKILWVNKHTKEKIEVYLNDPIIKENILFYKVIRIISLSSDFRIIIQFNSIKFNIPVDLKKIVEIKLPRDVKVNNMGNEN